jgi:hypothetical protein
MEKLPKSLVQSVEETEDRFQLVNVRFGEQRIHLVVIGKLLVRVNFIAHVSVPGDVHFSMFINFGSQFPKVFCCRFIFVACIGGCEFRIGPFADPALLEPRRG